MQLCLPRDNKATRAPERIPITLRNYLRVALRAGERQAGDTNLLPAPRLSAALFSLSLSLSLSLSRLERYEPELFVTLAALCKMFRPRCTFRVCRAI